jgi:hypothetical protein
MARQRRQSGRDIPAIGRQGIDVMLTGNAIFLTQKRLTHRSGVVTAIFIAALIGLSFLSGLLVYLHEPDEFHFQSPQEAGKMFYAWVMCLEIAVLVIGGFSKISRVLADDRKAGLWESNWLTPMKPRDIVAGYWFGSALREFYMALTLALIGLPIVLLAKLPITLWLGTQTLIAATALFVGLLGVLVGMAFHRSRGGIILLLVVLLFIFEAISVEFSRFTIINFLLPVDPIANLFSAGNPSGGYDWDAWPKIFAFSVPPILMSLGLQSALGIFIWRAVVRKTAKPFQPLLHRWEAVAIFILLIAVQHSLVWGIWQGQFGTAPGSGYFNDNDVSFNDLQPFLSFIHVGTIMVGAVLLGLVSPHPERVRVEALRTGAGNWRLVFSRSAVSLALLLVAIAAAASLTQVIYSFRDEGINWVLSVENLLACFLMFTLLLEYCRLRFKHRALGFVVLWLFVLCILPFIIAGIFSNGDIAELSFLSPGVMVLSGRDSDDLKYLTEVTLGHLGVVALLFIIWLRQWKLLIARPSPILPEH